MIRKYTTKAGDMWDAIAFNEMGSCNYTDDLINANRQHIETFVFSAGVELIIPEVDNSTKAELPAWRVS